MMSHLRLTRMATDLCTLLGEDYGGRLSVRNDHLRNRKKNLKWDLETFQTLDGGKLLVF